MTVVVWFRRDLRVSDNGALAAAARDEIVPLFVLDPVLARSAPGPRWHRLRASLRALDAALRDAGASGLVVRSGRPADVLPAVVRDCGADEVLVSGDFAPYGMRRDRAVAAALSRTGARLRSMDTPYLHPPGYVRTGTGDSYSVFTPFHRAWAALPVPPPRSAGRLRFHRLPGEALPDDDWADPVGEHAARELLDRFVGNGLRRYDASRDRPDLAGTSRLSAALHVGEIHPRTIVSAAADAGEAAGGFLRQLAWREFYADVLHRRPDAAWHNVDRRFDALPWRGGGAADELFAAWTEGRTGYPLVDAGMRQLRAEGWLHNRVRLVTASFLVKDLLVDWRRGADWFLAHLVDGDVANNNLGWQWVAGTGMDAAPYHRIFNPVRQGLRFDPDGDYVRRHVPELRGLPGADAHEPWLHRAAAHGYPERIVDHGEARGAALAAYEAVRRR